MERTVRWDDGEIAFSVKRSRRRRTVALRVEPSGTVTVFAPPFVWGPFIDRFVRQQSDWIVKKLAYFKDRPVPPPVTPELRASYTVQTRDRLPASIARLAAQLGVTPQSFRVANQTSRWGSCSAKGELRFSWRLATLPEAVFDYVVLHELAHLKVMNHSPRFWEVVGAVCPAYKSHRRWLRKNA